MKKSFNTKRLAVLLGFLFATGAAWGQTYTINSPPPTTWYPFTASGSLFNEPLPAPVNLRCLGASSNGLSAAKCATGDTMAKNNLTGRGDCYSSTPANMNCGALAISNPFNASGIGVPIYYATASDPWYRCNGCGYESPSTDFAFHGPSGAEFSGSTGFDRGLVIYDQAQQLWIAFYTVSASNNIGASTCPGSGPSSCALAVTGYSIGTAGPIGYIDWNLGATFSALGYTLGSTLNSVEGLVNGPFTRMIELAQGPLNHAVQLGVACTYPQSGGYPFPNSGSGGLGKCGTANADEALPGQLFWEDYTPAQINAWPVATWQKNWHHAFATYGGYVGQTFGGTVAAPNGMSAQASQSFESQEACSYYGSSLCKTYIADMAAQSAAAGLPCGTSGYVNQCFYNDSSISTAAFETVGMFANIPLQVGLYGTDNDGRSCTIAPGCDVTGHIHALDPCIPLGMAAQPGGCASPTVASFYISPATVGSAHCSPGSDSNDGTTCVTASGHGPWATPAHAQTSIRPLVTTESINVFVSGAPCNVNGILNSIPDYYGVALSMTSADSGSSGNLVTWQNYPGECPALSGGERITGWTLGVTTGLCALPHTNGYTCDQVSIPNTTPVPETLFYNGTRRLRPRLGATAGNLVGQYGHSTAAGSGNASFTYSTASTVNGIPNVFPASNYACADCRLFAFNEWAVPIQIPSSIVTGTQTINLNCGGNCPGSGGPGNPYQNGYRYILENFPEGLAFGGQWYLDRSSTNPHYPQWTLTYVAKSGENPNTDVAVIGVNAQVLSAEGLSYVNFSGLNFLHDQWTVPSTGYLSDQLEPNLTNALVQCDNCNNVGFTNNIFGQTTTVGLAITGASSNITTSGNIYYDTGAWGPRFGYAPSASSHTATDAQVPNHSTFTQSWMAGSGRIFPAAGPWMLGLVNNVSVQDNDYGFGYHGAEVCKPGFPAAGLCGSSVSVGSSPTNHGDFNIAVSGNNCHNIGQGITTDLGCFYANTSYSATLGSSTGNTYTGNLNRDVNSSAVNGDTADPMGHCVYLDSYTGLWTISNNLSYRCTGMGINMHYGPQFASQANQVTNNIFCNMAAIPSGTASIRVQTPLSTVQSFLAQSNVFCMGLASQTTANAQTGPPATSSNTYQTYNSNVWWFTSAPKFNVQSNPGISYTNWKLFGEDTAGTATTNPGFKAPNVCAGNSTVPVYGVCDDFSFTNGTGPGFGINGAVFNNTYGPTVKITMPVVADTFPVAALNPSQFTSGNPSAATPTCAPGSGTFNATQNVTCSTTSPGAVQCYNFTGSPATNGTTGCAAGSTLYSGAIALTVNEAALYIVAGGTGYVDSAVGTFGPYVFQGATPSFSPVAGTYTGTQTVTISQAQALAMCYTTDGSTPTSNGSGSCSHGTLYSSPVSVSVSETLKAIGMKSGWTDSPVGSAAYVIVDTLTLTSVTGLGSVSSSPIGINNCSASCSASFAAGSTVTLTATAGPGYVFSTFSGSGCSTNPCSVTMSGAESVAVTFVLANPPAPAVSLQGFVF